jgi:ABC-type molybdate transport system ATPase subunit
MLFGEPPRPRLLLLDEPLASLDFTHKREILPYLVRLRDEARVPMVYVSHTAAGVRRIATHIVRLDYGRVVASGGPELLKDPEPDEPRDPLAAVKPGMKIRGLLPVATIDYDLSLL